MSKSSSLWTNPLMTVPIAPITTGITVTFMFHSCCCFFQFPSQVQVFFFLFASFYLYSVKRNSRVHISASTLLFFFINGYDRLAKIWWSVCISKSKKNMCDSFSRADGGLCIYHLFVLSKFQYFAQFPVDHLAHPVVSSLILFLCLFAYYVIDHFVSITT